MLLLLACQSDPLLLPGLEPAIEGKVTATLHTGTVEQGTPMWLDATMAGPRVRGEQLIVTSAGGRDGRGSWDEWIVVPADGVTDPSPYWEDQQHGGARSHGFAGGLVYLEFKDSYPGITKQMAKAPAQSQGGFAGGKGSGDSSRLSRRTLVKERL